MIEDTLPKMSVTDMVSDSFVPVMLDVTLAAGQVKQHGVDWTPTIVVTDDTGLETGRWVGYLPEDDFLGQLHMALARYALKTTNYKGAERCFGDVVLFLGRHTTRGRRVCLRAAPGHGVQDFFAHPSILC